MERPTDVDALRALRVLVAWLTPPASRADDLLSLPDAARTACTRVSVLRRAGRAGDLPMYGGERDRSVRRSDLESWIESRLVKHPAVDDADVQRRMRRLADARARRK